MNGNSNKGKDSTDTETASGGANIKTDIRTVEHETTHFELLDSDTEKKGRGDTQDETKGADTKNIGYRYRDDEEVKHTHLYDGRPLTGTSTVMEVIAKPLTWWAAAKTLELLGWTKIKVKPETIDDELKAKYKEFKKAGNGYVYLPEEYRLETVKPALSIIKQLDEKAFIKLLDKAYYNHNTSVGDSAVKGTERHKLCEDYVIAHMKGEPEKALHPDIKSFTDWAEKNVERFLWSEMNCFSTKNWTGGISDAGFVDKQGKVSILDFKSSAQAYMSQFWQIAGYDMQISENGGYTKDGKKVYTLDIPIDYYTVFPFGAKNPEPAFYHDVAGAKQVFLSILNIYRNTPKSY